MRAIVISRPGDSEVLEMRELPVPEPGTTQVLVRIHAAGLNRSDIYSRKGSYGDNKDKEIPGLEIAGVVEEIGEGVSLWKKGDKVCALIAGGGYAEYISVDERLCLPVPTGFSFEEAASLPEAVFTVWFNVFKQAGLRVGEHFLVHGGSSGIGVTAIQMVTALGSKAFTTAGTDEKCDFCLGLGAARALNYKKQDWETELKADGMDVILDMVGGDYTPKNLRVLRRKGRLAFINSMGGSQSAIDIGEIMRKNLSIMGSMLKPQPLDVKAALADEIRRRVWPLFVSGEIRPVIHQVFPLAGAAAAQQMMEDGQHIGKIILTV
ncbi:MAG TPA: NAD(P)H-quinone oxidoreductase [Puia sp.]|nr:NAD(P)H-quinone oxidoreductase [Puia sp.]